MKGRERVIDWGELLLPGAILLLVAIAIVPAYRRATGSILLSGALATAAFAAFWLLFGGVAELFRTIPGVAVLFYCGILLTFTAWILSINAAAQMRRWSWVALLLIAGYLTLAAVFASFSLQNCFTVPDGEFTCSTSDPLMQALITLGYLVSPMAALAYGIYGGRAPWRRVRTLPDGLVASSLSEESPAVTPVVDEADEAAKVAGKQGEARSEQFCEPLPC